MAKKNAIPPWILVSARYIIGALFAGLMGFLSWRLLYNERWPEDYEWPHILAPVVAMFVAAATFFETALEKRERGWRAGAVGLVCLLWTVPVMVLCILLTEFHEWKAHLALLVSLYGAFVLWDVIVSGLLKNADNKKEVRRGMLLVNIPTLAACFVVFLYLRGLNLTRLVPSDDGVGYQSEKDAFVAGLVSFHIFFAAISYLLSHELPRLFMSIRFLVVPIRWIRVRVSNVRQTNTAVEVGASEDIAVAATARDDRAHGD